MYSVSQAYIDAMKRPVQRFRLQGSILIGARTVTFTEENLLKGSFSISNQCSGSEEVEIGTVYTAEMTGTFVGLDLTRYTLKDCPITVSVGLYTDDGWEDVPLGVYYITEANWSKWGVEIVAYDAMTKFDRSVSMSSSNGTAYDFLELACAACGVTLGMEEADILQLPNGQDTLSLYEENDVETWRDLVAWVAQTTGTFATIDRSGYLILVSYGTDPVDTIDDEHRYTGAKFSDFETRYTGLYAVNIATQTTVYYGLETDDGLTYSLGSNPLLQYGTEEQLETQRRAILNALAVIDYVPMEVSMIGNPAYDLGDVLVFSDGIADADKLYCITKFDWTYGGTYEVTGVGKNPALASARSKVDKELSGLASQVDADTMKYYDFVNASDVHIGDGSTASIIDFHYVTVKDSHVDFHAEIVYKLETSEVVDEDAETYAECDGIVRVKYLLNDQTITDYAPVETMQDGTHLLHLLYTWGTSANVIGSFEVQLYVEGATIDIDPGMARGYIAGQGLVGEDEWDGTTEIEDTFEPLNVFDIIGGSYSDEIEIELLTDIEEAIADEVSGIVVADYLLGGIADDVVEIAKLHRYNVAYSVDDMAYDGVTNNGSVWLNETGVSTGTLTTPDSAVSQILQITSTHSGDDVAYIVSFDGGEHWWTYANGWVEPDYTQDVYGMFEGTMRSIPSSAWAEKLTGTIMVRAILTESATVTDIQICTEVNEE